MNALDDVHFYKISTKFSGAKKIEYVHRGGEHIVVVDKVSLGVPFNLRISKPRHNVDEIKENIYYCLERANAIKELDTILSNGSGQINLGILFGFEEKLETLVPNGSCKNVSVSNAIYESPCQFYTFDLKS